MLIKQCTILQYTMSKQVLDQCKLYGLWSPIHYNDSHHVIMLSCVFAHADLRTDFNYGMVNTSTIKLRLAQSYLQLFDGGLDAHFSVYPVLIV